MAWAVPIWLKVFSDTWLLISYSSTLFYLLILFLERRQNNLNLLPMKKLNILLLLGYLIFIQCSKEPMKEPVANFSYDTNNVITPAVITFTNLSIDADFYHWDFGDNNFSTAESPSHTYQISGTFSVTLTAKNEAGADVITKILTILPAPTTYSVKNNSSSTLYSVCSYYWDGTSILDFILHGTLSIGEQTKQIETDRDEISLGFKDVFGNTYIVVYPYQIIKNTHNLLIIDDDTTIYSGRKKFLPIGINIDELEKRYLQYSTIKRLG